MSQASFNYQQLNMLLRVFFFDVLKTALKNPRSAFSFIRTLVWLRAAAKKRAANLVRGIRVPPIIILSITERCNLSCKGCYAHALHEIPREELSPERLQGLVREASDLGVSFFVVAGGEPFMKPELLAIAEQFPNITFLVFTNGLLIDTATAERLKKLRNIVPLLSLEGGEKDTDDRRGTGVYQRLLAVMRALRRKNVFFGTSLTLTSVNVTRLTDEKFVRDLSQRGVRLFITIEFTPVEKGTENLAVTQEQRAWLRGKIAKLRRTVPSVFINLPQDEEDAGGCLAAGRGFVHISAQGAVEPCPFSPFSDSNICEQSLEEALGSRLLATLRDHPDALHETGGGCVLWQKRDWVTSLLEGTATSPADVAVVDQIIAGSPR